MSLVLIVLSLVRLLDLIVSISRQHMNISMPVNNQHLKMEACELLSDFVCYFVC